MGNPAWGHGYGQGKAEGRKEGGIVGLLVGAGSAGLLALSRWGWVKYKNRIKYSEHEAGIDSSPKDDVGNGEPTQPQ